MIAGAAVLYASATLEGRHGPSAWDVAVREIGALLFVTAALTVVWDLHGRRQLTGEVLSAAELSKEITDAGLTSLTTDYTHIDWKGLLNRASNVDLFFAYAATWRSYHHADLLHLLQRDGTHVRVILPDRDDPLQVGQLAARFGEEEQKIVQKIHDAETAFATLVRESGRPGSLELRATGSYPLFTYYRFDGRCIGVLYSQVGKREQVPAFECQHGGSLHRFFSDQFESLWSGASARSLG